MTKPRKGLRIRSMPGVNPDVRLACIEFGKWLREDIDFPIRIVIYLKKDYRIKTIFTKELVSATFFAPYDKNEEPYIRIATGDYQDLLKKYGRDDALAMILNSIGHELIHYQQWLEDREFDEHEAEIMGGKIINRYADTRDHP